MSGLEIRFVGLVKNMRNEIRERLGLGQFV